MNRKLLILTWLLMLKCVWLTAQQRFDLYYLSVGSTHYLEDFTQYEEGFAGFAVEPSANRSAQLMGQLFDSFGGKGQKLLSTSTSYITRQKVLTAVGKMISTAQQEKKKNPLLIFYFCGHGLSEGFGWNMFMMPGDFRYNPARLDAGQLAEKSLYAGDVYDALEKAKIPFMMLLDCCYEGDEEKVRVQDFAYQESLRKVAQLSADAMGIVRNLNQYHEPNPVVFSTPPGTLVQVTPHPTEGASKSIGPLCRRTLVSLQRKATPTLAQYITLLLAPTLDGETRAAVCHWTGASFGNNLLK
jgi:hypothetical protein